MARASVVLSSLVLVVLAVVSFGLPGRAAAADPPAILEMEAERIDDGSWILQATLTRGGVAQTAQTVEFYQLIDFFGERAVPLGSARTDAAGIASRPYSPTSNGLQHIVARYAAIDGTFESDPREITVSDVAPVIPAKSPVLPIIQAWAFPVGAAILALVWLAMAGILLRAVIGIARPSPETTPGIGPMRSGANEVDSPSGGQSTGKQ